MNNKTTIRWDIDRSTWRFLDGKRKKTSYFLRKCIHCGGEYWGAQIRSGCQSCTTARCRELTANSSRAHYLVNKAVSLGQLPKLNGSIPCKDCGKPADVYDHREYAKPLDVDPVCWSCNRKRGPAKENEHLVLPRKTQ